MVNSMESIINRIKNRRIELDMSYQDLAIKTGLSKSTLQRYETGAIKNMPLDKLGVLASALNVDPIWLIGFESKEEISTTKNTTIEDIVSTEEYILLTNFNKLNEIGRSKVINYTDDLIDNPKYTESSIIDMPIVKKKDIWEEEGKEYLMPRAAHSIDGNFTEEEISNDDKLMEDEDLWK